MKSDLHLATRLRHLATSLLPLLCATPLVGATVTWDGGGDGTSWNDPANWVADTLPGPDDDAVIAGGSGTVQVTASAQVAGLQVEAEQNLRVSGSGTVFEATGLAIIDDVTIEVQSGAVVRLGQLTEGTTQSSWTVDGPGSRLELPSLERLVTTGGGQYFGASGEGAELNLSALTEIVPQGWGLKFRATSGGKVDLSALPDVAGDIELATYFQAEMDLSSLTRFEGHVESQVGSSPPTLKVQDTSVLRIPQLTKVKGNLVLYGDATVETEQLADLTGSLVLYGGEWEFPQIASIDDLTLQVRGGAVLRLPQITECVITTQTWVVEDAGSRLELSNLQTMTLSTGGSTSYLGASGEGAGLLLPSLTAIHQASSMGGVNIRGYSGARLDLGALTSVEGGVNFMVRFASELDLSSLESFPNPPEAPLGELHVYDTSVLRAPLLRQFRGDLLLSGDATVETDQLTDVTGTLTLSGGEWEFPLLPNIDDLALTLRDGAVLRLPQFTEVHAANVQRPGVSPSWTVYGNSTLEFPNLQRLVLDRNMNWDVQTGGRLLLPALTEIAFQGYGLDVYCSGDGSLVETPGLTELDGNIRIRATRGGTVDVSGLTRLNALAWDGGLNDLTVSLGGTLIAPDLRTIRAKVTVYGDATIATAQWEDVIGSLTLYGGEWEFPLLPSIDDLALTLLDGAVLRLPQFTEVHRGTEWGIDWNVYGGSTLELPSLQRLVLDRNMNWDVQTGGRLLLPALTEIAFQGYGLDVYCGGDGSLVETPGLTELDGNIRIRARLGGTVDVSGLTRLNAAASDGILNSLVVSLEGTLIAPDLRTIRAEVTVYGDATVATAQWEDVTGSLTLYGGEWEFPLLPNIDDLALTLRDGAVLRLPQFTEVHRGTEWGIDWNVYGGSTLDLPSLQRLVLDRNMNWDVQSGASLLLPALTEIALEGHSLDVHVEGQNARLELAVLPQLSGTARLRSLNGGLINLPQLLTFDLPPQNGYSGFIVHDGTIRLATESGQRCEGLADLVWEGSGMIEAPDLRLSSESLVRIPEKSTGTAVFRGSLTSSGSVRVPNTESLLRVEGNYQQTATGILELNLAPEQQNGKKLQMEVTQTCEFGGTLKLWAGDDYLTYAGGSLTVASHTGSVGEFDDVQHVLRNPDLLPPGKELYGVVLQYLDDALVVVPGWKLQPAAFPPEGGTVAEAGIFAPDALAPIIATPAMGWLFDHWEGAGITDVLSPNTTVLMDRNQNVTGVFVRPLDPSVVVTLDHNCPDISPTASTG